MGYEGDDWMGAGRHRKGRVVDYEAPYVIKQLQFEDDNDEAV